MVLLEEKHCHKKQKKALSEVAKGAVDR